MYFVYVPQCAYDVHANEICIIKIGKNKCTTIMYILNWEAITERTNNAEFINPIKFTKYLRIRMHILASVTLNDLRYKCYHRNISIVYKLSFNKTDFH